MRAGGAHAKGAAFERDSCRRLSLWLSEGEHDDLLWRSTMSGGRATVQFKKGRASRATAGDMSPISSLAERLTDLCLFECKHYRDLQLVGLYMGLKTGINLHWQEAREDAAKHKRWPVLIAKQNRLPTFMLLTKPALDFFALEAAVLAFFPSLGAYVLWFERFLQEAQRP